MTYYLVERDVPGAAGLDRTQLGHLAHTMREAAESLGVEFRWVLGTVAADVVSCVVETDDYEAVVEHCRRVGLPVRSITEIAHAFGPDDAVAPAPPSLTLPPAPRPERGLHGERPLG
ncbi:MAG TPA: DUF4242 domain-containing protein [Nocardioides sp.]|uniref:nickel-binding protein n=1 Tax=uncultured Nocardioides sp. TaxID=198441 RepID=UPI00261E62DC|nr:nickel-binding protein [uncultured Nocardioides sp.]HRD60372.1 DUF4242 domain-containing protein [Nocardioides sp.]HRI95079.1 DUF4242 domain-containing protein [Nocardioides sp.]